MRAFPAATLGLDQVRQAYFDSYQLEAKERFAEAIAALNPVLKAYGNTYTVNYRIGWLCFKNKSWGEAIQYYDKALAISPSSLEVLNGMIGVYAAKQDWKAAEEQCKRALQVDYNNFAANHWQIIAEEAQGNYAVAKKNTLRLLALYPTSVYLLVELGKIQYAGGEFTQAFDTFNSVQILDPYNQSASYYLNLLKTPKK